MVHACTISICILLYIVRAYVNFTRTQLLLIASGTIPLPICMYIGIANTLLLLYYTRNL